MAEREDRDGRSRRPSDREIQREFSKEALGLEQGIHPRLGLSRVHVRIGRRFISVWWLLPAFVAVCVAMVVAFKAFLATGAGRSFVRAHPCVQGAPHFAPGVSAWVIATHAANFFFMVMIVRSGWQILADHPRLYVRVDCTPDREWLRFRGPVPKDRVWTAKDDAITLSPLFGMPGGRHTIGVARHWHFIFDILFVVNGVVFIVLTFVTDHYLKLVPTQAGILPAAGSCIVQYSALQLPSEPGGFFRFDALQQLTYFAVVFVAGPLAILTGLAMSPALDNRFRWYQRLFGNRQIARSIHFLVMASFVLFFAVHTLMVAASGFSRNLNAITLGVDQSNLNGVALFLLALAVTLAFNVWAVRVSWTHTRVLQRVSNWTVGRVMDLLFDHYAPRVEYRERDISPFFWPNGLVPTRDEWCALRDGGFRDYRLKVHGLVEHPVELSLDDLRAMARGDHITMHNCIQGWSAHAERMSEESQQQRVNRELIELLNELRVALPGVQVLFAFLLAVPFQQRFKLATTYERDVYFATLSSALVSIALLIAPSSLHRLNFRRRNKLQLVLTSNRLLLAGIAVLGLAMIGVMMLISSVLFGGVVAIVAPLVAAGLFVFLWVLLPLRARRAGRQSPE